MCQFLAAHPAKTDGRTARNPARTDCGRRADAWTDARRTNERNPEHLIIDNCGIMRHIARPQRPNTPHRARPSPQFLRPAIPPALPYARTQDRNPRDRQTAGRALTSLAPSPRPNPARIPRERTERRTPRAVAVPRAPPATESDLAPARLSTYLPTRLRRSVAVSVSVLPTPIHPTPLPPTPFPAPAFPGARIERRRRTRERTARRNAPQTRRAEHPQTARRTPPGRGEIDAPNNGKVAFSITPLENGKDGFTI